jgi:hypothetical protein
VQQMKIASRLRVGQVNLHASRIEDRRLVNLGLGGSWMADKTKAAN